MEKYLMAEINENELTDEFIVSFLSTYEENGPLLSFPIPESIRKLFDHSQGLTKLPDGIHSFHATSGNVYYPSNDNSTLYHSHSLVHSPGGSTMVDSPSVARVEYQPVQRAQWIGTPSPELQPPVKEDEYVESRQSSFLGRDDKYCYLECRGGLEELHDGYHRYDQVELMATHLESTHESELKGCPKNFNSGTGSLHYKYDILVPHIAEEDGFHASSSRNDIDNNTLDDVWSALQDSSGMPTSFNPVLIASSSDFVRGRNALSNKRRNSKQKPSEPKKLKAYEIEEPFQDHELERKRRNAVNAKRHRDMQKNEKEFLEQQIADMCIEKDILLQRNRELESFVSLQMQKLEAFRKHFKVDSDPF
ncbi:hypothetical protein SK128_016804 [Halocaridina rubra]|uniref:BZIP domain-containing protein n=1 Tax=Halocaridina rubra TaxID=373956 RepID=A0AAN8X310_HALRR